MEREKLYRLLRLGLEKGASDIHFQVGYLPLYRFHGELVELRYKDRISKKNVTVEHAIEEVKGRGIPEWLSFDATSLSGRIVSMPTREQINLPVQEQLIVELYSK